MAASFTTSKKTFTQIVDGVTYMEAANINVAYDEIEAEQTYIGAPGAAQSHNASLTDMLINNCVGGICSKKDADEIYVSAFYGIIPNAAGTVKKHRVKTTVTTLSAADLDTGIFVINTYYYIYATADNAATTPVFVISASASAPTGYTHYKKIGWFYNEAGSALDITTDWIGNIKDGRDIPNAITITGATDINTISTSYVDMTGMTIYFVSNGRPVEVTFIAPVFINALANVFASITIDTVSKEVGFAGFSSGYNATKTCPAIWLGELAAGTHTIKIQWKVSASTGYQYGATEGKRMLVVKEL
jgi:hypothetical protein